MQRLLSFSHAPDSPDSPASPSSRVSATTNGSTEQALRARVDAQRSRLPAAERPCRWSRLDGVGAAAHRPTLAAFIRYSDRDQAQLPPRPRGPRIGVLRLRRVGRPQRHIGGGIQ